VKRLVADRLTTDRCLWLPDACSHLREDIFQLALGLAIGPPVAVRAESEAMALAVDAEPDRVGESTIAALAHADLAARSFLHLGLLVSE
jgi:hypothetical protein